MEIKYKQFVIVPKRPRMSVGKIASQVAHATYMGLRNQKVSHSGMSPQKAIHLQGEWHNNGMCVIVFECKDSLALFGIAEYLKQWKVPHHLYIDEGLTQVKMGTPTALATGVLTEDQFWIFEKMRLFR